MEELIDKIPPPIRRRGAKAKYPWKTIKPGQAFKFSDGVTMPSATSMAYAQGDAFSIRLVVRKEPDGIWCYRVDGLADVPENANLRHIAATVHHRPSSEGEAAIVGIDVNSRRKEWEKPNLDLEGSGIAVPPQFARHPREGMVDEDDDLLDDKDNHL